MTLSELDAKLAEVKEKQGGLTSKYAKQLLLRKKTLRRLKYRSPLGRRKARPPPDSREK